MDRREQHRRWGEAVPALAAARANPDRTDPRICLATHFPLWLINSVHAERREAGLAFRLPCSIAVASLRERGAPTDWRPNPNDLSDDKKRLLLVPSVPIADGLSQVEIAVGFKRQKTVQVQR